MDNRNKLKVWLQQHHLTQKDLGSTHSADNRQALCCQGGKIPGYAHRKKQRPALPGLGDSGTQSHG